MIRQRLPPCWQNFYRYKNPPDNKPQFYFVPKVDSFCNETVHFTAVQYSMKPYPVRITIVLLLSSNSYRLQFFSRCLSIDKTPHLKNTNGGKDSGG
jgi:hypothetical protein